MLSFTNKICRPIRIFLTFGIIILFAKAWIPDLHGLAAAESARISKTQVGKRVEPLVDENPIPQITTPMLTVPPVRVNKEKEDTESGLKKSKKMNLTLESAINRALAANRGLQDVMDQVEGANLTLVAAASEFELKIIPAGEARVSGTSDEGSSDTLGAGVSLQKKFDVGTDISVTPQTRKTDEFYSTGVDAKLSQPLLRGFGREYNLSGVRSAEFGTRSSRRNLYLRQVSTVLLTINAVYDVIRQRELYQLNEESAQRLRVHAEAASAKNKIGMSNQIDVYRAGIQQKQAEDNLNTAREAYSAALDNLKILLSLPLEEEIEVEAPLDYSLVRLSNQAAVDAALKNRVELDQAKDNIRETERLSRVAKHNIWPDFDVIDAETKLRSAQTNLLTAVINYIVGTNRLRGSMGTLVERPRKF